MRIVPSMGFCSPLSVILPNCFLSLQSRKPTEIAKNEMPVRRFSPPPPMIVLASMPASMSRTGIHGPTLPP